MKYRKKPVVIDAFKWTGGPDQAEDPEWAIEAIANGAITFPGGGTKDCVMRIHTLEGDMTAQQGDYIIRGVNGEIYPCKPDIFEKTYESADRGSAFTLNEHARLAQRTANPSLTWAQKIRNGVYGLNGEAGECIDLIKKAEFQGHELDVDKLVDELGDVLWYIVETASGLGVTLQDIADHNINKLLARYPQGFDSERSIHREE